MYCLALLKSEDINIIGREYLFISNFSFCRERITFLILKPAYNGVAFSCFFFVNLGFGICAFIPLQGDYQKYCIVAKVLYYLALFATLLITNSEVVKSREVLEMSFSFSRE